MRGQLPVSDGCRTTPKNVGRRVRLTNNNMIRRAEQRWFYILLSPWIIGILVFTIGPVIATAYLSLTRYDMSTAPTWIGLANYAQLFAKGSIFWTSLRVTLIYTFVSVPLQIGLGTIVAVLLNYRVPGMRLIRALFYLPTVIPQVSMALLWLLIFTPNFGVLNWALSVLHVHAPEWLNSPDWVIWAFVLMSLWGMGSAVVIFLAALQSIPPERYEAARIDGANPVVQFWKITLPGISPVILFNTVMGLINALQIFIPVYILTDGGPTYSSYVLNLNIFQTAFNYNEMGLASAEAWILFLITSLITFAVFGIARRWVYYESTF